MLSTILGNAYVRVRPDMDGFDNDVKRSVRSTMASAAKIAAIAVAGAAAFKGAQVLKDSVRASSDLNESLNAVNVTFGKSAAGITKLGESAARTLGLSQAEFNGLAVQFSNFATTVAGDGGDVTKVMADLTGRASDFASVMNLDVAEAATLFQSGLAGETEPLRRYGIDLSAAAVEAYALANGIGDGTGELTEQEKVLARYGILMEQTSKTQGDFANTSDGLANQQRILKSTFEDSKAAIGSAFTPLAEAILPKVTELLSGMTEDLKANMPQVQATMKEIGDGVGEFIDKLGGWDGIKANIDDTTRVLKAEWPAIRDTFENVAGAVERVSGFVNVMWEAFQKLPPEVQTLLAMFAIAQKSGVVSIALTAADAVKGLVSNIRADVVNVNGPVAGGGAGGAAGGAAGKGKGIRGRIGSGIGPTMALMAAIATGEEWYSNALRPLIDGEKEYGELVKERIGHTNAFAGLAVSALERVTGSTKTANDETGKYVGILSQKNTVVTYSNALTNESREAIARQNAAVAQSTPLTVSAASSLSSLGASAANSSKTAGLLTGAIHAAGTASSMTDAQVKAMTSAVLSVPASASLPQLQSAIGYAGRAAGLTDAQIQGVTASVLAVPRDANFPALKNAITNAGAAAGLTDTQIATMTAAVLAVPPNASLPQLREAIAKAGASAGLTDTQIQGVTAAALAVPRDTPANVSTNAPAATSDVNTLQSTINSLTGTTVRIGLSFSDAGYSDSRATYYGTGGGGANSEPDIPTYVQKAIAEAVPKVFSSGGGSGAWRKPAGNYSVSSEWMRGGSGVHYGIDLAGPVGSPIFAAAAGSVGQVVYSNTGYGNMIRLDHGGGLSTLYAHLAGAGVRPGQVVRAGQIIGAMGSTGDSTGPHLHFETKVNGAAVEPRNFMAQRGVMFDSGGYLEPGWTSVYNGTGKPEPVFTDAQWQQMSKAKEGATYNVQISPVTPASPDEVAAALRRVDLLYGVV